MTQENVNVVDQFVPDPEVWDELGVTPMTGWRYTRDPNLNFPPPIKIRNRNYRSRKLFEQWKAEMLRRALENVSRLQVRSVVVSEKRLPSKGSRHGSA